MHEALLQYIWKHSLFDDIEYLADTGEKIKVLEKGMHNHDGGPDFANAKIMIDGTLWAGNVEIHVRSSDWNNHGHQNNPAYDNVILHVVSNLDCICRNHLNRRIPCIQLSFDPTLELKYNKLVNCEELISCSKTLKLLNKSILSFWLSALAIERLCSKTKLLLNTFSATQNNWEETFYIQLAQCFGLKINTIPFEMVAKSIPFKLLLRHHENLFQIEALLFGQAGFLKGPCADEYQTKLQNEYNYLKKKYKLKNIEVHLWKFLRLRPPNFPTIRLAELGSLIHYSKALFSKVIECKNANQVYEIFRYPVSDYWKNHYTFGNISLQKEKYLGRQTIDIIIINVIVPFMFKYGEIKNNEDLKDRAIQLLEGIAPEDNFILRKWNTYGIVPRHAADTQALIQLTHEYCENKRCLDCQIGNMSLKSVNE